MPNEENRLIEKILNQPALFIRIEESSLPFSIKRVLKKENFTFIGEVVCYLSSSARKKKMGIGIQRIEKINQYLKQYGLRLDDPAYTTCIDNDYNLVNDEVLHKAKQILHVQFDRAVLNLREFIQ